MSDDEKLWAKLQTMDFNENEFWDDTNEFQKFENLTDNIPLQIEQNTIDPKSKIEKNKILSENLLDLDETSKPLKNEIKFGSLNQSPANNVTSFELLNVFESKEEKKMGEGLLDLDFFYDEVKNLNFEGRKQ
jgi:hypothetical protein